jgi:hypothetical protein
MPVPARLQGTAAQQQLLPENVCCSIMVSFICLCFFVRVTDDLSSMYIIASCHCNWWRIPPSMHWCIKHHSLEVGCMISTLDCLAACGCSNAAEPQAGWLSFHNLPGTLQWPIVQSYHRWHHLPLSSTYCTNCWCWASHLLVYHLFQVPMMVFVV